VITLWWIPIINHTCDYNLTTTNLNEKSNEKWAYVIPYGLHPLIVDNQNVFATIFVIIYTHDIYITIAIQNVFEFIY
jgi:hypothetical protein